MRQRITFVHRPEDAIDPGALIVTDKDINGPHILASKEERTTLALEELPDEIARVLRDSHELHIRWVRSSVYETLDPLSSRLSPGLHVFYTPQTGVAADLYVSR